MNKPATPAFLTGSRAYGTPREDSDWDLVVLVHPATATELRAAFLPLSEQTASLNDSIKVGRLNLLLCTTRLEYDVWKGGTRMLMGRAPVTRDDAIKYLKGLRQKAGIIPGGES